MSSVFCPSHKEPHHHHRRRRRRRGQVRHVLVALLAGLLLTAGLVHGFAFVPTSGTTNNLQLSQSDGMNGHFVVVHVKQVPIDGLDTGSKAWKQRPKPHSSPNPKNVTLPICLLVMEPDLYPTLSRARKAIRTKQILVQCYNSNDDESFNISNAILGKTDTRVHGGDYIIKQQRKQSGGYHGLTYAKPLVTLPVVYQDEHMAIVNKPSGMISYSPSKGGFDKNSVLRILPHVLEPPAANAGAKDALEWPVPVHRLDAATCGLLVIAKTKRAATHFSMQFSSRKAKKSYIAILNGNPINNATTPLDWNLIDHDIDGKPAQTLWRVLKQKRCMHANNMTVTQVEFRPLQGRTHQLRRHAAEVLKCPIVGDGLYDDGSVRAVKLRHKRGNSKIFLCSYSLVLEHFVNDTCSKYPNARIVTDDDKVRIEARIDLPQRFDNFMTRQEDRMRKYEQWMMREGLEQLLQIYEATKDLVAQ